MTEHTTPTSPEIPTERKGRFATAFAKFAEKIRGHRVRGPETPSAEFESVQTPETIEGATGATQGMLELAHVTGRQTERVTHIDPTGEQPSEARQMLEAVYSVGRVGAPEGAVILSPDAGWNPTLVVGGETRDVKSFETTVVAGETGETRSLLVITTKPTMETINAGGGSYGPETHVVTFDNTGAVAGVQKRIVRDGGIFELQQVPTSQERASELQRGVADLLAGACHVAQEDARDHSEAV